MALTFVLAALFLSLAGSFVHQSLTAGTIYSTAAVIGVVEWFYYRYARQAPILVSEIGNVQPPKDEEEPPAEGGQH